MLLPFMQHLEREFLEEFCRAEEEEMFMPSTTQKLFLSA